MGRENNKTKHLRLSSGFCPGTRPNLSAFSCSKLELMRAASPNCLSLADQGERGASGLDGRSGLDGKSGPPGPPGQRVPQLVPNLLQLDQFDQFRTFVLLFLFAGRSW